MYTTPLRRGSINNSLILYTVCISSSSSFSRNEYYLGGIIALLLRDHRTMSTKVAASTW